jgi:ATP-binding cassette subfamily B (MDR/TAP) protein 1
MPIATLISGFIFAFITGWLMTLVIISVLPALALAGAAYMSIISDAEKKKE